LPLPRHASGNGKRVSEPSLDKCEHYPRPPEIDQFDFWNLGQWRQLRRRLRLSGKVSNNQGEFAMSDAETTVSEPVQSLPCDRDDKRRILLNGLLLGALAYSTSGLCAQNLIGTPAQTEGPFYPDKLPLDQDNDLVIIAGNKTTALGEITHLTGRILDLHGTPLSGVVIEIWQVDYNGRYIHSADASAKNDTNFQGYGRFETGRTGEYRFRTIKPVPYPMRTPHIHVRLHKGGRELLTTQLYVQGHPLNERDGILRSISNPQQRASVLVPFLPKGERRGELAARFDIVLGLTPAA
jgi:protocatechuate 3,4-dioxygenase beta subunit